MPLKDAGGWGTTRSQFARHGVLPDDELIIADGGAHCPRVDDDSPGVARALSGWDGMELGDELLVVTLPDGSARKDPRGHGNGRSEQAVGHEALRGGWAGHGCSGMGTVDPDVRRGR